MRILVVLLAVLLNLSCGKSINENPQLRQLFQDKVKDGTFVLYDVQSNIFELYNFAKYRDSVFSDFRASFPLIALIGVETGVLNTEQSIPNGLKLNLEQAVKNQDSGFFAQILHRIDTIRLRYFLDTIKFGLTKPNIPLYTRLSKNRLSFDQLLGFIKKVYASNFPFQSRTYSIVSRTMIADENTFGGDIYYYSWDELARNRVLLGWIEVRKRPYFFILAIPKDSEFSPVALLHEALEKLNLFIR